jgi:hypothetical protein
LTTTALAASAYLAREAMPNRRRIAACAIAGICLGSAGLAKLQSLPIALVLFGFVAAKIFFGGRRRWKSAIHEALVFAVSLILIPAIVTAVLCATGELRYAIRSYLQSSVGYVGEGIHIGPSFLFESSPSYTAFFVGSLIVVVLSVAIICWKRPVPSRSSLWIAIAALLLVLAAGFSIYTPRRPFSALPPFVSRAPELLRRGGAAVRAGDKFLERSRGPRYRIVPQRVSYFGARGFSRVRSEHARD